MPARLSLSDLWASGWGEPGFPLNVFVAFHMSLILIWPGVVLWSLPVDFVAIPIVMHMPSHLSSSSGPGMTFLPQAGEDPFAVLMRWRVHRALYTASRLVWRCGLDIGIGP